MVEATATKTKRRNGSRGTAITAESLRHKEADCRKKAVDHKKENKEAAAVAVSRSNVEFCCVLKQNLVAW